MRIALWGRTGRIHTVIVPRTDVTPAGFPFLLIREEATQGIEYVYRSIGGVSQFDSLRIPHSRRQFTVV